MKIICVPLSRGAMSRLDTDTCTDADLLDVQLDAEEFEAVWRSGLFTQANRALALNIDECEDERILGTVQLAAFSALVSACIEACPEVGALLKVEAQVRTALELDTGVYFFF